MLNITQGNPVPLGIQLRRNWADFVPESEGLRVRLTDYYGSRAIEGVTVADGRILATVPATVRVGKYGIEITGTQAGSPWRTKYNDVLNITDETVEDVSDEPVTMTGDYYDIVLTVNLYGGGDPADLLEELERLRGEVASLTGELIEKDEVISQKDEVISQKDAVIAQKNEVISGKDEVISGLEGDLQESQQQLSDMTDERDDAVYVIGSFFGGTVVNLPDKSFNVKFRNLTVPTQIESCGNFFQGTKQIESINLGGITRLDDDCFRGCTNLNTVVGVNVIECGTNIFRDCTNLETVSLPKLATIYNEESNYGYLFYSCSAKLKTIDLPALEEAGAFSFVYCSNLKSVSLPKCKTFGNYSFQNCRELEEISLPEATSAAYSTFQGCSKLKKIEFFKISSLSLGTATIGSGDLKIILRNPSVVTLPSAGYIASDCTIYVPDELLSSYKSANNWRNVAEQIKGLSEYVE